MTADRTRLGPPKMSMRGRTQVEPHDKSNQERIWRRVVPVIVAIAVLVAGLGFVLGSGPLEDRVFLLLVLAALVILEFTALTWWARPADA